MNPFDRTLKNDPFPDVMKAFNRNWTDLDEPSGDEVIPAKEGAWEPIDLEEEPGSDLEWRIRINRFGTLRQAWLLVVDDEIREIIELWSVEFYRPDKERACERFATAECCYRYPADQPNRGQIYPFLRDALQGEGGIPLSEARAEGLAYGLKLPPDCDD